MSVFACLALSGNHAHLPSTSMKTIGTLRFRKDKLANDNRIAHDFTLQILKEIPLISMHPWLLPIFI